MIILRQNSYSDKKKSLKKTRVGIGWLQEELGKNESEDVFNDINLDIDKKYENNASDEEIIKSAKKAGKKRILRTDLPKIAAKSLGKGALAAGGTLLLVNSPKLLNNASNKIIRVIPKAEEGVYKALDKITKNKGKTAAIVGSTVALGELMRKKNLPKTIKKAKAGKNAGERTAKERLKSKKE